MSKQKLLYTFLLLALFSVFIVGCGQKEKVENEESGQAKTRIITDMVGNDVELPNKIERVYITSIYPLPAVYSYYKGSTEGLVGIPEAAMVPAKQGFFSKVFPDIKDVSTAKNDVINIEEILALKPDVVFYNAGKKEEYEMLKKAGIPAVGFTTAMTEDADVFANLEGWLDQLGEIFGDTERSDKLIAYNKQTLKSIVKKTQGLEQSEKPRAMIIYAHNDNMLQIAGSEHYSQFWLEKSGAINVASSIKKIGTADMEQILAWDPEVIYITSFTPTMPEDLIQNQIKGYDWSKVTAVKNKQVYKIPMGTYRWFTPSVEASLMLQWMTAINHPQWYEENTLSTITKDFFKEFYQYKMTDEELDQLYRLKDSTVGHSES
ncbi:ABC transporter substrate-binding protein [Bacillus massiliigorillae]|uniref:ABC transporter substrate-binding protein n=1 Tax=Bacillus massiliigorillae TaxID=1243664 RepID=UPI0003AA4558|nr:ABC transporter substrate-binding protein [Bacillus massiliigorillae]